MSAVDRGKQEGSLDKRKSFNSTYEDCFGGGYTQSMPASLHLWQDNICLSHFLFDFAHALQALGPKGVAIPVSSHSSRLDSHLVKGWTIEKKIILKQGRVLTSRVRGTVAGRMSQSD